MGRRRFASCLLMATTVAAPVLFARVARADSTVTLDGNVPDGPLDHFFVPFQVPDGTAEIEILHDDLSDTNILDFGLNDPNGYRGWGGGTSENIVIGVNAASRAFVPGPLPTGTWNVVVGKAKIVASPAQYHLQVTVRTAATLPTQTDRKAYAVSPALKKESRFYAVDLHTHSRESTDARADLHLDEMLDFAAAHGLDGIEISDHNTVTQFDYFVDAQARHPNTLLIPGIEFTTYAGHANAMGATKWVDHKIGQPNVTIAGAAQAIHDQGALFSINHPVLDLGNLCIGCAWKHDIDPTLVSALEIETGAYSSTGFIFFNGAAMFWEKLLATGHHVPAVGGSDDHKAGVDEGMSSSVIGQPVTMVRASELSVAAILDGIKNGQTVVKLQDFHDPMINFTSEVPGQGDSVHAKSTIFRVEVTGGQDETTLRIVKNGVPGAEVDVIGDPYVYEVPAIAPATGEDHYRAEVLVKEQPRTVTSHIFLALDPAGPDLAAERAAAGPKGGCAITRAPEAPKGNGSALLVCVGSFAVIAFRRIRRRAD